MIPTESESRMNFRRTKIARSVQSSESGWERLRAINIHGQRGARLFSASIALFLRSARVCIACRMYHAYIHTHAILILAPIYRGGNLEIHGRLSTCRFLPVSRCVCVRCDLLSPSWIPHNPHIFFSFGIAFRRAVHRTLAMYEEDGLGPTRPLAGPRGSSYHRLACQLFIQAKLKRAEPSRADTTRLNTHSR